jgi:hypothetical protein
MFIRYFDDYRIVKSWGSLKQHFAEIQPFSIEDWYARSIKTGDWWMHNISSGEGNEELYGSASPVCCCTARTPSISTRHEKKRTRAMQRSITDTPN